MLAGVGLWNRKESCGATLHATCQQPGSTIAGIRGRVTHAPWRVNQGSRVTPWDPRRIQQTARSRDGSTNTHKKEPPPGLAGWGGGMAPTKSRLTRLVLQISLAGQAGQASLAGTQGVSSIYLYLGSAVGTGFAVERSEPGPRP